MWYYILKSSFIAVLVLIKSQIFRNSGAFLRQSALFLKAELCINSQLSLVIYQQCGICTTCWKHPYILQFLHFQMHPHLFWSQPSHHTHIFHSWFWPNTFTGELCSPTHRGCTHGGKRGKQYIRSNFHKPGPKLDVWWRFKWNLKVAEARVEPERSGRYMVTSKLFFAPRKTSTESEKSIQLRCWRGHVKSVPAVYVCLCLWHEYLYIRIIRCQMDKHTKKM